MTEVNLNPAKKIVLLHPPDKIENWKTSYRRKSKNEPETF